MYGLSYMDSGAGMCLGGFGKISFPNKWTQLKSVLLVGY